MLQRAPRFCRMRGLADLTLYSESMAALIRELSGLPGIGEKSAERLAYHILRSPREQALRLAQAIQDVKERVTQCSVCFNMGETDPCQICSDEDRDRSVVCVVEERLCLGCGACAAQCRSGAATARHFTVEQILAEIEGVLR